MKEPIKCAWDHGINTFDNAESYAAGQSEIEMGQAFKDLKLKREELVVTTSKGKAFSSVTPANETLKRFSTGVPART